MISERSGNEREERKNNDICRIGGGEGICGFAGGIYRQCLCCGVGAIRIKTACLRDSIKSWVARVGVSVLVDGTEVYASASSRMIRETAEELGLDYFKISSSIDVDLTHTSKCKNAEEIVKDASYTVGNVLLIGCSELAEDVVTKRDGALRDRVVAVLPPEEENIRMCREAGYPLENIICMTVPQPEILLRGLIEGRNIIHMVVSAEDIASIKSNLRAAEAANIKVSLYGELRQPEGMSVEQLWNTFVARLGIREH